MNEDLIIQKLIQIEEKMENSATTAQVVNLQSTVLQALDQQLTILQRLDQERLFTIERIKRIEADVERLKLELKLI